MRDGYRDGDDYFDALQFQVMGGKAADKGKQPWAVAIVTATPTGERGTSPLSPSSLSPSSLSLSSLSPSPLLPLSRLGHQRGLRYKREGTEAKALQFIIHFLMHSSLSSLLVLLSALTGNSPWSSMFTDC